MFYLLQRQVLNTFSLKIVIVPLSLQTQPENVNVTMMVATETIVDEYLQKDIQQHGTTMG